MTLSDLISAEAGQGMHVPPLTAPRAGPGAKSPMRYMRQLDGLRAIAVAAVFIEHNSPAQTISRFLPWGALGVRLFFVLSGFLITGILLTCRTEVEGGTSSALVLRQFYIRRFLRIFPIYYLTLAVMSVVSPALRNEVVWFVLYIQNLRFTAAGAFTGASHFWSLAVEEQFYIFWPFMILAIPTRWLKPAIVLCVLVGPITRLLWLVRAHSFTTGEIPFCMQFDLLTPACLDTLAMGALLAIIEYHGTQRHAESFGRACFWLGLPLLLAYILLYQFNLIPWLAVLLRNLSTGLFFTWVVARAAKGFGGMIGRLLGSAPLVALGRISYGFYIYHFFVPNQVHRIWERLFHRPLENPWEEALLAAVVSIAVAAISWHFLERPLNDLKRYFPYKVAGHKQITSG